MACYSELSSERQLLDCSRQQSDKLASKVDELGLQLDQMQHEKYKVNAIIDSENILLYVNWLIRHYPVWSWPAII